MATPLAQLSEATWRRLPNRYWYYGSGPIRRGIHPFVEPFGILCTSQMRLTDRAYDRWCIHCLPPRRRDFIARELRRFTEAARSSSKVETGVEK